MGSQDGDHGKDRLRYKVIARGCIGINKCL